MMKRILLALVLLGVTRYQANGQCGFGSALNINGGTTTQIGQTVGTAGNGRAVQIASNSSIFPSPPFTIETWVYYTGNNRQTYIASTSADFDHAGWKLRVNNWVDNTNTTSGGKKLHFHTNGGTLSTVSNFPENVWTHVAVVVSSNTSAIIYINGLPASTSGSINLTSSTYPWQIGANYWTSSNPRVYDWSGSIDEMRYWTTARTQAEIQANMYQIVPGNSPGLFAYFQFNNGTANSNNTGLGGTTPDSGPNGYNGTIYGLPLTGTDGNFVNSMTLPPPPISGTAEVCVGGTTQLSHTVSGGTWTSSNTAGATVNSSGLVTGVAAGTSTISYTFTDANGCQGTSTVTVTTKGKPSLSATNGTVCGAGQAVMIVDGTNMTNGSGTAANTLKWFDVPTGGVEITSGVTVNSTSQGRLTATMLNQNEVRTYYVEASNTCGTTTNRTPITATSYQKPNVVVTSASRCGSGTLTLSATADIASPIFYFYTSSYNFLKGGASNSYTTPILSSSTNYVVRAYNSQLTCSSDFKTLSAVINTTATWDGTGNWSDATKWSCGSGTTPTGSENITVSSGTLTLSSDVTMTTLKTLSVNSGATLAIAPAYALTIPAGAVLSNSGTVLVDANSGNQGQLLLMGTYTELNSGTVTVRRAYNVSSAPAYAKWIQISAPVDADLTSLGTVQANNLFYWNASNNNWTATTGATKFEAGKGYTAYYGPNGVTTTQSGTIELSGSPFVNPVIPTIAWSNGASNNALFYSTEKSGWNLVGNPLTSNLDFSAFSTGNGRNNVENSFYRWDPNKGGPGQAGYHAHAYTSADGNNNTIIPPLTAVWVRATSNSTPRLGNGNIGFSTHGHRNGTKPFTNTSKTDPDKFLVSVSDLASPLLKDNLSLAMIPGASDAFDGELDAWELLNSNELPNVYANFNEEWTTAKAVDFSTTSSVEKVIPVGVKSTQEMRPYRMHLNADLAQEGYTIYLKDRLLKNVHNLSTSDYVFAYTSAMEDRFELILTNAKTGALGLEEASRGALTAWVSGSELWITGLESGAQEIDVVGMDGRVVLSAQLRAEEGQPTTTVLPELPAGLYTVRVRANGMERGVRFAVQR